MKKEIAEELTNDVLIADVLLRLKTIENLLMSKGIFSEHEYISTMQEIAHKIAKSILQKSNVPGELDELINNLQGNKIKLPVN